MRIYQATSEAQAQKALDEFGSKWCVQYPQIAKSCASHWPNLRTLFDYPPAIRKAFMLGDIAAPAKKVSWPGISKGESWLNLGASLTFGIALVTSTFVYLQFHKSGADLKTPFSFLP